MVLIKHNYPKSDIFFNPIFIPGFSRSRFLGSEARVQDPGSGSESRVRVQVIEVAFTFRFFLNFANRAEGI